MDEPQLLARCQAGDLTAFNVLVERYQGQVFGAAYRMLGQAAAAEDVTQEAFISAWKNLRSLRGDNFRAWLLRIAINGCHDYLRRSLRHPERSLDAYADDPDDELKFPSGDPGPEETALTGELRAVIDEGLATLPADQRAAVVLFDMQGLTYEEIAEVTGASLGTVKSRLSRGRGRLREYLSVRRELLPRAYRLP
ncbi:MAG: sigma-70 family RNA polymerase sigma factor [Chloroflexi bacterium]|nr:sigma-70 family RNA polymerase sigma factor [Chloroflexota bacterium]